MPTIPSFALTAALTPSAPRPGQVLTATLTLNNSAGATITGAVLTATLPAGVVSAVTTSQGTFTLTGSTLAIALGTIAAGATLSAVATIESQAPGTAAVAASLASDQGTAGPATASVTVATRRPTAAGLRRLGSRPSALPPGVYSLWKNVNGADFSALPPGIVGIFYQAAWDDIETAEGVFDWTATDAMIDAAADAGLVVSLSLGMGGAGQTPNYVFGLPGIATIDFVNTSQFQNTAGQLVTVPIPWNEAALARKVNFIRQAGARYAGHPAIRAVAVDGAANGNSNDWYYYNFQGPYTMPDTSVVVLDQVQQWRDAGYTTPLAFGALRRLLDAAASSWPGVALEHPVANADPDNESSPNIDDRACTLCDELMAYGWGRWPARAIFKWHRLKANTPDGDDPTVTGSFLDSSKYKFKLLAGATRPERMGFQFASHCSAPNNFRQAGGQAGDPDSDEVQVFNDTIAVGLTYPAHVFELWTQDATNPAFATLIQQATDTLRTLHAGN